MNVFCPACMKRVAVPDEAAGKPTSCPTCGQTFTPPTLTPAGIDAVPPPPSKGPTMEPTSSPPPPPPPTSAAPVAPPAVASPPPVPSLAGGPCMTMTLSLRWVKWLAPIALIAAFVLSFLPWVGSYPNGTAVYAQSGWRAMRGGNPKVADPAGDKVMQKEDELKKHGTVNGLLLLYCFLLIPAAALSAGIIATSLISFTMPDAFTRIWNHRDLAMAALSLGLPVLLAYPLAFGFGVESAAAAAAEEKFPPLVATEGGPKLKAIDVQEQDMKRDVEVASYALDRSWWLRWAILAQAVALFGTGATLWLNRRGAKPEPRMELHC